MSSPTLDQGLEATPLVTTHQEALLAEAPTATHPSPELQRLRRRIGQRLPYKSQSMSETGSILEGNLFQTCSSASTTCSLGSRLCLMTTRRRWRKRRRRS